MAQTAPAIRLNRVSKWFFKDGNRIAAVEDVSADIPEGAFIALVGPSGCGKSTLFNCIAGFEQPERGEVIYRGSPVTKPNIGIGYMTQKDSLMPWRSVLANVMLPLYLQKVPLARGARAGDERHIPRGIGGICRSPAGRAFGRHAEAHRACPHAGLQPRRHC